MYAYQANIKRWMIECFGSELPGEGYAERAFRFLEEALELVQACGCSREHAEQVLDYVYHRPVGEIPQEVGGVMVTLAALCNVYDQQIVKCAYAEYKRINTPRMIKVIQDKQTAKRKAIPIPGIPEDE